MKKKLNMENKCLNCINGAIVVGERASIYILKEAINKEKHINYKNNESGCRRLRDIKKLDDCIKNDFKHHEEFLNN
jgi:hypothetical protein